jgi:hypothetical protein
MSSPFRYRLENSHGKEVLAEETCDEETGF